MVIISSSHPSAILGFTLDNLPDKKRAAIEENKPLKLKRIKIYLSVLTPENFAASGLFPIIKISLPKYVLCKKISSQIQIHA